MKRNRSAHYHTSNRMLQLAGWIFLSVAIVAAIAVIVILSRQKDEEIPVWEPVYPTNENTKTPEGGSLSGDTGGRHIIIDGIHCSFTPPAELTFGVEESLDLSSLADTVCANARRSGWGNLRTSSVSDGSLLFSPENTTVLPGDKYEEQAAFLESSRPEDLARTFLTDCGLYDLLGSLGIQLSLDIERDGGALVFRGSSGAAQSESWVRMNFLYDGSLNQMKIYASHLADAVTTQAVLPLEKAAAQAVSWQSAGTAATQVTAVEIRSVGGIPFYVLTCADGTIAYSLAVEESALEASPRAKQAYERRMLSGIQEYVRVEGAGY